VATPITKACGG